MRTVLFLSLVAAATAAGQPVPPPADGKVVVRLDVTPAPVLQPHYRVRLLPDMREARHGNVVQGFLKCMGGEFGNQKGVFGPDDVKRRERLNQVPLTEFDLGRGERLDYGGPALRMADEAARMTYADWQVIDDIRRDGISTLLPDLPMLRNVADALHTRTRGRIKAGAFDKAAESAATTLALGRACETHPCLIGGLVGIAVCNIGLRNVEEMIQQPGCPNLYWALTDLPTPLVSLRIPGQGERLWTDAHFPQLLTRVWSADETKRRVAELEKMLAAPTEEPGGPKESQVKVVETMARWAADPDRVAAGRRRLIDTGVKPELVKQMSAGQAVLADDYRQYEIVRDELLDALRLPYPQAVPVLNRIEERYAKDKGTLLMAPAIATGLGKVIRAQVRQEQTVAALRVGEGVRLYAHEKGGNLPPNLDALTVPAPLDPVTGQPFRFSVKDGVATLHPTAADPTDPKTNRVYEIRIRR